MSESEKPEIELDLDLQLLPAWARQPQTANRYANFEDAGGGGERRGPRGRGPGGPGGPRRDFRGGGGGGGGRPDFRRPGGPGGPGGSSGPSDRGQQRSGGGGGGGGGRFRGGDRDRDRRGGDRGDFRRPEPQEELPEGITVDLIPDPTGVDSLARQIRQTGRAYPLFDIAHLILKRPDRYQLHFRAQGNNADGTPRQFHTCNLDDTVWMTEAEATRHVLSKHFGTFYQTEKIAIDPPKGTYTFVAQCGMSGIVLGPPNLHDYQGKLQRLHTERYSRLPFDVYKSRVRIVRDEAVVKQWIEEQSFKFEYSCLNLPEPLKLASRDAVEQHFRQVHLPNIIKPESSHVVRTPAAREALPPPLRRLARREFDLQQRFPLKLVTRLSDDFAHRGLHFFKVNKTVLHVAVARPRFLDLETSPVSEGVKRIVDAIEATPDCTRRKLLEALGVQLPPADAAPAAETPETPPSPELSAIVGDLHWLIHEGHVIEFANGRVELAKKPAPRPTPPPRPPKPQAAAPTANAAATVATSTDAVETSAAPTADAALAPSTTPDAEASAPTELVATPPQEPAAEGQPSVAPTAEAAMSEAEPSPSAPVVAPEALASAEPESGGVPPADSPSPDSEEPKLNPS
ncbi:MAG: hypothetical protein AB7O66_20980 [Limisphaerales bacterium]